MSLRFALGVIKGADTCEFQERNKKVEGRSRPPGFSWLKQEESGLWCDMHMWEYSKKFAEVFAVFNSDITGTVTFERSREADQLV
jgi:hypothetical protein